MLSNYLIKSGGINQLGEKSKSGGEITLSDREERGRYFIHKGGYLSMKLFSVKRKESFILS